MISIPSFYSLSEDRQRLLKGLVFSILFHLILILVLGGISMIFVDSPSPRVGPLSVSIDPEFPLDGLFTEEEPSETVPEDTFESLPDETEPEIPEVEEETPEVEAEPEFLPEPEVESESVPVPETEPENLPEPDLSLEPELEIPESSPGEKPSDEDSPAPVEAVQPSGGAEPAASVEPAAAAIGNAADADSEIPSDGNNYVGSSEVSDAYAELFSTPREAEANTGGRSGEVRTAPEETPAWESSGSGIYSSDVSRTVVEQPAGGKAGSPDGSADGGTDGDESVERESLPDLEALDEAISRISNGEEGVYIFNESESGVTASIPGNEGENTSQISFLDGEGRQLKYSEPPKIPAEFKNIGLPENIVTVYFSVTPDGAVAVGDLKIDPSSGNNELDTAIKQCVRNWIFTGGTGNVRAKVQFLIKVK